MLRKIPNYLLSTSKRYIGDWDDMRDPDKKSATLSCIVKKNSNYYLMLTQDRDQCITMPTFVMYDTKPNINAQYQFLSRSFEPDSLINTVFQHRIYQGLKIPPSKYSYAGQSVVCDENYYSINKYLQCYFDTDYKSSPTSMDTMLKFNNRNYDTIKDTDRYVVYTKRTIQTLDKIFFLSEKINDYYELSYPCGKNWKKKVYLLKIYPMVHSQSAINLNDIELVKQFKLCVNISKQKEYISQFDHTLILGYQTLSEIIDVTFDVEHIVLN